MMKNTMGEDVPKNDPVRIGVIGCGSIAQGVHLPLIQYSDSATLQAVCDIKPNMAKRVAARYGALKVYTRIEDILDDSEIEAVIVSLWHDSHPEVTREALRRGKHVLVEKPMAMRKEDAAHMVREAELSGKRLLVGYMWRYDSGVGLALEKVKSGVLGHVDFSEAGGEEGSKGWEAGELGHMIRTEEPVPEIKQKRPDYCEDPFVNFSYEYIMDAGSHTIDLLRLFLGEPSEISYTDIYRMNRNGKDFYPLRILSVIKFPSATVYYNLAYLAFDITGMSLKMRSDIGRISVFLNPTLMRYRPATLIQENYKTGSCIKESLEPSWCFEIEHDSFVKSVRDPGHMPPSSAHMILPVNSICEAIVQSWLKKGPVTLDTGGFVSGDFNGAVSGAVK